MGITPTNIVVCDTHGTGKTARELAGLFKERGVLISVIGETRFRALTHLDVTEEDIDQTLAEIKACLNR